MFLDEIESMSLTMQAKLLRVLEARKVQRLGGGRATHVNMRVIAASNVPLRDLVSKGQMRNDFYYRVSVVPIHLIPLRERRGDIPLLAQDFLRHHPVAGRKRITAVSDQAMSWLIAYHYQSARRDGPFVTINCAGIPETLLESELFGYERGGLYWGRPG